MIDVLLYWFMVALMFLVPGTILCFLIFETLTRIQRFFLLQKLRGMITGDVMDLFLEFYHLSKTVVEQWEKQRIRRLRTE